MGLYAALAAEMFATISQNTEINLFSTKSGVLFIK